MALKDWKKVDMSNTLFENQIVWRNKKNSYWEVIIFKEFDNFSVRTPDSYERERFKTKSQALSFAKSYMRTH